MQDLDWRDITKKEMVEMYTELKMTCADIAASYDCSPETIRKLLQRFNIQPRLKGREWQQ